MCARLCANIELKPKYISAKASWRQYVSVPKYLASKCGRQTASPPEHPSVKTLQRQNVYTPRRRRQTVASAPNRHWPFLIRQKHWYSATYSGTKQSHMLWKICFWLFTTNVFYSINLIHHKFSALMSLYYIALSSETYFFIFYHSIAQFEKSKKRSNSIPLQLTSCLFETL